MSTTADIPNYEDMISALNQFSQKIFETSGQMLSAGSTCASQTNDEGIGRANESLQKLQKPFGEITSEAKRIAGQLMQILEKLREAERESRSF